MKNISVKKNPDKTFCDDFLKKLIANNNYCPCRIEKIPENRCMCKEFRELLEDDTFSGYCHCGYYIKEFV